MHEKRQILLDRNSLISHLKNNGHEEDLLLGMSYKKLFELYSMEESDLVNYHASDATKDEYFIGLGNDTELGEGATVQTRNDPGDAQKALEIIQGYDPEDPSTTLTATGDMEVTSSETGEFKKIPVKDKNIKMGIFQEINPEDKIAGSVIASLTSKETTAESRRYDKKTLEEKFARLAKSKSFESDKKIVMEMINKQTRPASTKGKIMEYILNHSK